MTTVTPATADFTVLLLGALGHGDGEYTSLLYENGDKPHTAVIAPAEAVAAVPRLPKRANSFFGVNPTAGPARTGGRRGSEADVTRLAALWCDLDIKSGACPSLDVARAIVANLSIVLNTRPSILVDSGHGLHAYWPVADGAIGEQFTTGQARALLRRWGRLVAAVAEKLRVRVDNVYDMARMLRIPGTFNNKNTNGQGRLPVTAYEDNGGPLTVAEIDERLTELGIGVEPEDTAAQTISEPETWTWAQQTCPYVAALIDGLPADGPAPGAGRHPWLCHQSVRLACACRLGCITEDDLDRARGLLATRFTELLAGEPPRAPGRFEIAGAWRYGVERASVKSDAAARAELGGHPHYAGAAAGETDPDDDGCPDEPIPLAPDTVEVPPFPVDALPDVIGPMVTELAEATQTDPAMAGTSALTVLATCAGGHAKIQVRRGWREPLCLYTNTIARPSERKSAVQEAMAAPLHDAENELSVAGAVDHLKLQDELEMAKKTVDQLNKAAVNAAAKAASPDATKADAEAAEAAAEAARAAKAAMREIKVPVIPRLLADDVTPEATASLLADHGGRIAIVSTEGGIFDTIAGRYARKVNMDVYLKGHSGDRIRVDRQGREPQSIPSPALTMGLMVQPRVIEAIAANRDFVGRGLLARFLYATPASKVGSRVSDATPVSDNTEKQYSHWIKKLASDMAGWAGDPAVLMLDPRAEAAVRRIQDDVEPALAGDGELASPASLTEWGGKYVGAVVRTAGLLHLGEHGAHGVRYPVQPETIEKAERIGRYFKAAAINVFSGMGNPDIADAVYLLRRLVLLGVDEVSERDILICGRSRFPTKEVMAPVLKRLTEHGYLIPLEVPRSTTRGRPASPRYRVHPSATEATEGVG